MDRTARRSAPPSSAWRKGWDCRRSARASRSRRNSSTSTAWGARWPRATSWPAPRSRRRSWTSPATTSSPTTACRAEGQRPTPLAMVEGLGTPRPPPGSAAPAASGGGKGGAERDGQLLGGEEGAEAALLGVAYGDADGVGRHLATEDDRVDVEAPEEGIERGGVEDARACAR